MLSPTALGKGDLVVDFFGGAGSTLIASQAMGRLCRMMEIDPRYCDVIIERWQQFTNKSVRLRGRRDDV